jgi:hypothetical protein
MGTESENRLVTRTEQLALDWTRCSWIRLFYPDCPICREREKRKAMARVLLDKSELERIDELVREFDPANHPSCEPILKSASSQELNIFRGYVADGIRTRLGLELLARAASETAVAEGWVDAADAKNIVDGALGAAETHGLAYSAMVLRRKFRTEDISVGAYELVQAAREAMFGKPFADGPAALRPPAAAGRVMARTGS